MVVNPFLFIIAGVFVALVSFIFFQLHRQQRARRLMRVTGIATHHPKEKTPDIAASVTKNLSRYGDEALKKGSIPDLIQQAGFTTPLRRYWAYATASGIMTCALFTAWGAAPMIVILFGLGGFLGLPKLYLQFRAYRRQKLFLADFADALDAMVRLLKAGMPVTEAIAMVGREFQGPVAVEMAAIYDQQRVGVSLAQAAEKAALRVPIPEMHMFATAVAIQSETGASLSEVLTNLSGVIRARFRLKRKVVALSSEARTSAIIIGSLPIMVALVLRAVNPEYMNLLFSDRTGHVLLWACGFWMFCGILVMRAMINFRV